jgi:drug/metabolite transporter (DMT)-like permease
MDQSTLLHAAASLGSAWTWATATLLFARLSGVLQPMALNAIKVTVAAPLMVILTMALGGFAPMTTAQWGYVTMSTVLGLVLADLAYMHVLRTAGPTIATLCIPTIPPATALLASVVLQEGLTLRLVVGMILAVGGVVVVVTKPGAASGHASKRVLWWLLFYVLAQAVANVATKFALRDGLAPLQVATTRILVGSVAVWLLVPFFGGRALFAGLTGPTLRRATVASVIGTALGIVLGSYGLSGLPTGVAVTIAGTTPVWLVLMRWLVDGDKPTTRLLCGVGLAVAGIVVFAWPA